MKYINIIFILIYTFNSFAQNISGVVNIYTPLVSVDPCEHYKLEVSNSTGFTVGDKVMIIQMQGLTINETNTVSFGTFNALADTTTGFYEIATINNITGNVLSFTNDILNKYNPNKNAQVVRIPQYTNVNVNGLLTPQAWNGTTGGVLAIEVSGTLTISANISAQGRGFRGGKRLAAIANSCNALTNVLDYATDTLIWQYKSFKGEGVATYVANKWASRGPQANGGGGGNDHNAGGGGGANKANGGLGGRNNEPGIFNCKGYQPGLGGLSLASLIGDRIFMGGGGGTGHENNNVNFAGGNGGGIIYIKAGSIVVSGNRSIIASGDSSIMSGQDGGSGGGAGGTIILDVPTFSGNLTISANGGRGASTNNGNTNRCFGPGGGGSGGVVNITATTIPGTVTVQTNAGAPGIVFNTSNTGCRNTSNSGTAGGAGSTTLASAPATASSKIASSCNPLPVVWLYFNTTIDNNVSILNWATASEINNDYFEILRSSDGINYTKIGIVKGKGNTTQTSYYEFIDSRPLNGANYYRLKQVDTDKKFDFSNIQYIHNGLNWTNEDVVLYPNPINDNTPSIQLIFPSTKQELKLYFYDLVGNLIHAEPISAEDAVNGNHTFYIDNMSIGNMTIVKFVGASGEVFTKKIVKF